MVGKRSLSDGARSKKMSKSGNPSAQKSKRGDEEEEDVVFLGTSRLESEQGKIIATDKAKDGAQEDSDEEEIRLLFEEMAASRKAVKESRKIGKSGVKNKKSGGAGSSRTGKEVEKRRNKGKKKAVAEEEERKGKKVMKNKVAVEEEDDASEREAGSRCKFPMKRIQKIMKDHDASAKLAQDAIFLANKASEKFLELYCREAYACAFLDHKKQVSYDHLASVVSKRKRFDFLSGHPTDWAAIEELAHTMKEREKQQLAQDPSTSNPQNPRAPGESSNPGTASWLKRQKTAANVVQVSSGDQGSSPEESESPSLPSALDTVSGLKLMSLMQNMNMLSLEMISRRNNLQILRDLDDQGGSDEEPAAAGAEDLDDQGGRDEEPAAAGADAGTSRASEAED